MVADATASGIQGRVIIRPVRSVERRGVTNQRPYQAKITVLDRAGREVAAVESDAEGRFQLPLPAGAYVLRPESPGAYPRAAEQRVLVRPNDMTQVEIVYDSGMR
jgi:carboxypeptidase family protein